MRSGFLPVLVAAGVLCSAPSAYAATLTVDDDKADCPAAGFTSVQAAVDAAAPGDTIVICQGKYAEGSGAPGTNAVTISKNNLTLKGAGAGFVTISPKSSGVNFGSIIELDQRSGRRNGLSVFQEQEHRPANPNRIAMFEHLFRHSDLIHAAEPDVGN